MTIYILYCRWKLICCESYRIYLKISSGKYLYIQNLVWWYLLRVRRRFLAVRLKNSTSRSLPTVSWQSVQELTQSDSRKGNFSVGLVVAHADDRKAYDKAQVFDISILQGYKYENIKKYKQFGVPKGMHCYSALKDVYRGKMAISACYMLAGTETLFHIQISMGINEFKSVVYV